MRLLQPAAVSHRFRVIAGGWPKGARWATSSTREGALVTPQAHIAQAVKSISIDAAMCCRSPYVCPQASTGL